MSAIVEATDLYESYLEEHPDNADLYFHLIDLTFGPLDDPAHGYALINRAEDHLSERDCRALRLHREAVQSGEYRPLKHLGWCKDAKTDHPLVAIPEALRSQFAPPPA